MRKNISVQKVYEDERLGVKPSGPLHASKWFIIKWSQLLLLRRDQTLWTLQQLTKRLLVHFEIFRVLNHINSIRKVGTHGKQEKKTFKKMGRVKIEVVLKLCRFTSFFCFLLLYWMCCWSPVQPDIPILNHAIRKCCFIKKQENHKSHMIEENSSCSYLVFYIYGEKKNKTKHPKWWIYAYSKCRLKEKWQH